MVIMQKCMIIWISRKERFSEETQMWEWTSSGDQWLVDENSGDQWLVIWGNDDQYLTIVIDFQNNGG